jgi:hypothetical protein
VGTSEEDQLHGGKEFYLLLYTGAKEKKSMKLTGKNEEEIMPLHQEAYG